MVTGLSISLTSAGEIRWKMTTINDQSPFEACGTADFNGDGRIDIFCGDSWYQAPASNAPEDPAQRRALKDFSRGVFLPNATS